MSEDILEARRVNSNAYRWVESYRAYAHQIADINPIALVKPKR